MLGLTPIAEYLRTLRAELSTRTHNSHQGRLNTVLLTHATLMGHDSQSIQADEGETPHRFRPLYRQPRILLLGFSERRVTNVLVFQKSGPWP